MAKVFVKDLVVGENLTDQLFLIKQIGEVKDGKLRLILSDKTGECAADIGQSLITPELMKMEGQAINVSAVIMLNGLKPLIAVLKWEPAGDFRPVELYNGITPEKAEEYKKDIRSLIGIIKHTGYHLLVEKALTEETLDKMASLPVTISQYGRYAGASLVATDVVTRMIAGSMASYCHRANGLNTKEPAWSVLIAASLLQHLGRQYYFDEQVPFKRSPRGVALSYFSTLQMAIEKVISTNEVPLSDQEVANLLNILNVAVSNRTDVKAISKEGAILRHMITLYGECDAMDWEEATHEKKDGEGEYYWSNNLKRWVMGVNEE